MKRVCDILQEAWTQVRKDYNRSSSVIDGHDVDIHVLDGVQGGEVSFQVDGQMKRKFVNISDRTKYLIIRHIERELADYVAKYHPKRLMYKISADDYDEKSAKSRWYKTLAKKAGARHTVYDHRRFVDFD